MCFVLLHLLDVRLKMLGYFFIIFIDSDTFYEVSLAVVVVVVCLLRFDRHHRASNSEPTKKGAEEQNESEM